MTHSSGINSWRPDYVDQRVYSPRAISTRGPNGAGNALPFYALMSFTFILLLSPQTFFPTLAPFRIALVAAAASMMTYLLERFRHQQLPMGPTREMRLTASLVGWAVLTVPFSYWPGGSVSFLLGFYFKTLVIFWLVSKVVNTRMRLRQVTWGLSLMAVPLALAAVNHYRGGHFISGGVGSRIVGYEGALTGNPNDLALMLNLILPLSVALFLMNRKLIRRAILLGIIALLVIGVVVTFSRGGFVTLAVILLAYAVKLCRRPERRWVVAALVVILICAPLVPSTYLDRLSTITDIESDETGSAQERWKDTVAGMDLVLQSPIVGAGVGMNILALNDERGATWKPVHNVYLQYAVELAIPGLVLFLLLFVGCVKCTTFVQRQFRGLPAFQELFYIAEGIQVSLVAFAVAALFHPVAYHFYFYYIAGLAIAVKAVYEGEYRWRDA